MARKVERKNYGRLHHIVSVVYLLYCRLRFGRNVRIIPLSKFKFAIVDEQDYKSLSKFNWRPHCTSIGWYAVRWARAADKTTSKEIFMHRVIVNAPPNMLVDHENHRTLDNRRSNLRPATYSQNCCNRRKTKSRCSSRYKGVSLCKAGKSPKRWMAYIYVNHRQILLGYFEDEIEAARAYDAAAVKYHGEFACLNFPKRNGTLLLTLAWMRNLPGLFTGILRRNRPFPPTRHAQFLKTHFANSEIAPSSPAANKNHEKCAV